MVVTRFSTILILITFSILAVGCVQAPSAPTSTLDDTAPKPQSPDSATQMPQSPDELLHISGEGSYVSDPFTLSGSGAIKVYWRQKCTEFGLIMVNTNDVFAEAPLGTVTFEFAKAPSEYIEDSPYVLPFEYVPGEYVFKITADGTWEVWAKVVYPEGE